MNDAHFVDEALYEIACRLLHKRYGVQENRISLNAAKPGQAKAWALAAQFLGKRLQASVADFPGRQPDMGAAPAAEFRAVLAELAGDALQAWAAEESHSARA